MKLHIFASFNKIEVLKANFKFFSIRLKYETKKNKLQELCRNGINGLERIQSFKLKKENLLFSCCCDKTKRIFFDVI